MEAEVKITRTLGTDAVLLSGKFNTQLTFIGSSCKVSVNPGDQVDSFSVSPWNDVKWDVVAVRTSEFKHALGKHGIYEFNHFLLLVTWQDARPWVEVKKPFVPDAGRFGQIIPEVGLSVTIGDEFFLAPVLALTSDRVAELRKTYRLVPNAQANLLCRFIAGTVTPEEVVAVAETQEKQVIEVEVLRAQLEEVTQRATFLENEVNRALELSQVIRRRLEECEQKATAQRVQDLQKCEALRKQFATAVLDLSKELDAPNSHGGWLSPSNVVKLRRLREMLSQLRTALFETTE